MLLRFLVLGAVQGATEFVPVSSSGHLVLVPFVAGWPIPGVGFDVAVHLGTALGVAAYFWRDLAAMVAGIVRTVAGRGDESDRDAARLGLLIAIGTVPVAVAGLLAEGLFEELIERPAVVALLLVVTAGLLVSGEGALRLRRRAGREPRGLESLRARDAITIGIIQVLALAPGISRSGVTITGGLSRGLSRDAAARFAFLLSLPAILGAGLVQVPDLPTETAVGATIAAAAVAAVVGFVAIAFLLRFLRTRSLAPFAAYCLVASGVALTVWFLR